jgi:hypothetical protein
MGGIMRRLPLLVLAFLGLLIGGCGDDDDGGYRSDTDIWGGQSTIVGTFALTPSSINNAAPGSVQTSNPEPINVVGPYADISVVNGEYSINMGTFVSGPGIVRNGDNVRVRHVTATTPNQTVTTTVTIGDKSATFSSTTGTIPPDLAIDTRQAQLLRLNMLPAVSAEFDPVTVTMSAAFEAPVSIEGGEYSVNSGPFVTTPGMVRNNAQIRVRHITANGGMYTTVTTMLTVAHIKTPFTSSTADVATQRISVTAAPNGYTNAQTIVLTSGRQALWVQEGFGLFSWDNVNFYDAPPEYPVLKAGQVLYLMGYTPGPGETHTVVYKVGDLQQVILELTGWI